MESFSYKNGTLYAENIAVPHLAQYVPTPFYCYTQQAIMDQFSAYKKAFRPQDLIAYALKANSHQAILTLLAQQGAGADIVSQGELFRAQAAQIPADKIIYSGVGKTSQEIDYALTQSIKCFNVESEEELLHIHERAKAMQKCAPVSLRINPDVDAQTHEKISTGKAENKFGIPLKQAFALYQHAHKFPFIQFIGVDIHIGSQICSLAPFQQAFAITADFIQALYAENISLHHVDIGGGLGIVYNDREETPPSIAHYAQCALNYFEKFPLHIICEPGRNIVGNAGILVTSVLYIKKSAKKNFVIVDAAMNDLIRPTLYNAWQEVLPVEQKEGACFLADIVGPVCETGDYLALDRTMPELKPGDLLAVKGAGAYGAAMASTYNSRLIAPEILVNNNEFALIRQRSSYEDLIKAEDIPHWLQK